MKKLVLVAALALVSGAQSGAAVTSDVISGAGAAHAAVGAREHLSLEVERDFSGTYGVGTWVNENDFIMLYLDCVAVAPGGFPGDGDITASGLSIAGSDLPILRSVTVRVSSSPDGDAMGIAMDVRGTGPTCGSSLVPMRTATAAATFFAP